MTPEESQRQRHLAEMMIAQCDGKIVQSLVTKMNGKESWHDESVTIMVLDELHLRTFRIKPEPRECYVCFECLTAFKTYNGDAELCARDHGEKAVVKVTEGAQ